VKNYSKNYSNGRQSKNERIATQQIQWKRFGDITVFDAWNQIWHKSEKIPESTFH